MKAQIENWFEKQHWNVFDFQKEVWNTILSGQSGLLHASTGSGKTYAVWMGIILRLYEQKVNALKGLKVLWITPMRALAQDTLVSLKKPLEDLNLSLNIGLRTSDTSASIRRKQQQCLPDVLITTPESLSLLLSLKNSKQLFKHLKHVVVDEWHELMGNKRGVQCELALTRLNQWHPNLQIFGLSATFSNVEHALKHLCGSKPAKIIKGLKQSALNLQILEPKHIDSFPLAGHMGLSELKTLIPLDLLHNQTN